MAAIATHSAVLQHPVPRHSLHTTPAFIAHPAPPFEGIVDFTQPHPVRPVEASHTLFGPYTASSDLALQHRADGSEWKQPSFFSYRPNEVKHRKRTTRQQLKVLEETFKTTQKPDGNVRKALAAQLDMTPRNVQVWFQNRRAKDKTLAKRAKAAEDVQAKESSVSLDDPLSAVSLQEPELLKDSHNSPSNGQPYPQERSFQVQPQSGSVSPVEATFPQKYEVPTPVHLSQDLTPPSHAISSTSTSFSPLESEQASSQHMFNYSTEAPSYSRALFASRSSLPHIHATSFQPEIQHQRSNSSPAFLCNVDTMSNLSLTTCASINGVLYPHRLASNNVSQQQTVYNSSYPRVPPGPLPSSDFSFGLPAQNNVRSSVSGTDTPSSLSGLSHYGSVASLVDSDVASIVNHGFDDDSSAPFGWQSEQRRGSAPHAARPYPTGRMGGGFSPLSVGYSSCSPRVGATPPNEPETDGSENAIYIPHGSEWMPTYEEPKSTLHHNPTPPVVAADTKNVGGFPQEAPSEATFHYMTMLEAQTYNQPLTLASQISGLDVSFGSNNQLPLGGFRPIPASGYHFA